MLFQAQIQNFSQRGGLKAITANPKQLSAGYALNGYSIKQQRQIIVKCSDQETASKPKDEKIEPAVEPKKEPEDSSITPAEEATVKPPTPDMLPSKSMVQLFQAQPQALDKFPQKKPKSKAKVRYEKVVGSRRGSNYFWAIAIGIGSITFLNNGFFGAADFTQSQQTVMSLYGVLGSLLTTYVALQIAWAVGDGFNEYNKSTKMIRIFRWGFPGDDRRVDLKIPFKDVAFIELGEPNEGLFLRIKGKKRVKLTSKGWIMTREEIEYRGAELARFIRCTIRKKE